MGLSIRFGFGQLILLVFLSASESARLIGCYKEISNEARLLSGAQQNFKNTLTPEKCISFCKGKGFLYAGLQYSYECFCAKDRPSFIHSADSSDCNSKCDGDKTKICGGGLRLSVYDLVDKPVNYVQPNYVGCYADEGGRRALTGKVAPESQEMTPELCVGFCFRNGYRYAGLQYRNQCYCGEEPLGPRSSEGDCDMECAGDSRFLCGGGWRNSVYQTSIPNESEQGKLIGCFIDSQDLRLLSGFHLDLPETNSPRKCLNICKQLGYSYAGVQYGIECHCGNRKPESEKETNENQCLSSCPDGTRRCGGNWRLLIYSTASVPQPVISGVVQTPNIVVARPEPGVDGTKQPTAVVLAAGSPQAIPVLTLNNPKSTVHTTTRRPTVTPTTRTTTPRYPNTTPTKSCIRSHTLVQGRTVCQGERLFHDSFLGNGLNGNVWTHEVFMPSEPDYEFVVFDNNPQSTYTSDGRLHIKLIPFEDTFVRSGKLELNRCTGRLHTEECIREAKAFSILPPIQSSRITTKNFFSFKYGKVLVRAKLPLGDWIVPEIWLEPKRKIYGPTYSSGKIRIAVARGNRDLISHNRERIGNNMLESGILMGTAERVRGRTVISDNPSGWYKQFHNYTLIWGPDNISFEVDGENREDLLPERGSLSELLGFDSSESAIWQNGSPIAPFDQEFYISLGLSVGGMKDFPDGCITGESHSKPWKNEAVKAMVNFWQDRDNWLSSWNDHYSQLQVEHVSVYAL
ncbi:unnamed protein product [Nezara viridula]|uniref:Uncharacterized protein n=1 Tax=Nezara viridula TaxID=85310 RepID=A0A9P0HEH3_NEZVI|nr:unnamed protein product [Nezara viridula]